MTERVPTPAIADQAERDRALDVTGSFIVQAPAGSGKTELLIERFLGLLASPGVEEPESVIAITFTRKAAGEMRHRVISALQGAVAGPVAETASANRRRTAELARRVLARDAALDWNLVDHPSRLRIRTIDSLAGSLVYRMPWVSRMGAPPEPEESPEYLYRQAARATLELLDSDGATPSRAEAVARLLTHLDNDVGRVASLLVSMLGRRDQWLRHVVGNPTTDAFRASIESAFDELVAGELEDLAGRVPAEIVPESVALARFAASNLRTENSPSPLAACGEMESLPPADVSGLPRWQGLAEMFLKRNGERRTRLNRRQGFPPTEEGREAAGRCLAIPVGDDLAAAFDRTRQLRTASTAGSRWDLLRSLMEILPVAVAQLKLVFQSEGKVDFTEIGHACGRALGSPDAPTDLAFSVDCRIRHLLVDEFQDTSQSQFELLRSLTADWQPGDGRTLFLVGDPMQSIYAFREAEVGLFLRSRRQGIGNLRPTPLQLSVNFRSSPGIVDWVNRSLGAAFPETENIRTGAVPYTPSMAFDVSGPHPAVTVHPAFHEDRDSEAERVLEIIRQARAGGERSIAVLVRARSHLTGVVRVLRRAGERFRAVEIDALGERPVVQDLMALTRALVHPADRVSWLAVLRAPWCGLTLADLHALAAGDRDSALWDLLRDPARLSRLSGDGRARVKRISEVLDKALDRRQTMPLRRWIEGVWIELGGPACLDNRTDLEDAAAYLDLLEESSRGANLEDEREFERAVAFLHARPDVEADESLQLLTIHKAKGLEFDTVILPGLGRSTRREDPSLLMWLEYLDREGRPRLLMAPVRKTGGGEDPLYAYLRRMESVKDDHESTRLLYVAATRARRVLHLLGHVPVSHKTGIPALQMPSSRSPLMKIWASVESGYRAAFEAGGGMGAPGGPSAAASGMPGEVLRRLSLEWEPPPRVPAIEWDQGPGADEAAGETPPHPAFEWASELQRRVGIVVHQMLERIDADRPAGWNRQAAAAALRMEGLDGEKLADALERVELALESTLADPRGLWILSTHAEDRREYAVSTLVGQRVRRFVIDRTFVDDGVRWIIDYKTGVHQGGGLDAFLDNEQARYRGQLEAYAETLQQIDSHPIRLGLYFPMLRGWREWSFTSARPAHSELALS